MGSVVIFDKFVVLLASFSGALIYCNITDVINLVTVIISWVCLCGAGCPVGSNNFVGEPLCVEVPVRVLREVSLVFGARLCWGGGGNVTFHGIQVPRELVIH